MSRFILTFLFGICLGLTLFAQESNKPNILFIFTDDLGYHDLSYTGSEIYQTPHIDRLAGESLTFGQAYSSYPRCTPSRYALMTGTYPVNEDHGHLAGIAPEKNFINKWVDAGYQTSYVGKWHLGGEENAPKAVGFHHSFAAGSSGGVGSHFFPFNKRRSEEHLGGKWVEDVDDVGKEGDYLTDLLTDQTIQFIRNRDKDKPFFAMLAYYAVHTPLEAKPEDEARNRTEIEAFDFGDTPEYIPEGTGRRKMRQDNAAYAGMVENVDENIGRLLDVLEEMGLAENTIIIFSSDHGGLSNDGEKMRKLATTNNPLRAGKGHLYEGGIRVPLLLHWKKKIEPASDPNNIILGMDIFPTLFDLVFKEKVEGIDGQSYIPVLEGRENWKERTVFWHSRKARPHSTGDIKCSVIRSGDYKLLHFFEEDRLELYNVREDISETHNLAAEQPELAGKLLQQLNHWKTAYLVPEKMYMKRSAQRAKKAKKKK